MATLKDINMRLKAVKNIQKITKSMKIVSAAKFAKAEKELRIARPYGAGAQAFYEKAECAQDAKAQNHLIVTLTSDRGLCGAIHSGIVRAVRADILTKPDGTTVKYICVGDKTRGILARTQSQDILCHFAELGRKPPVFEDASLVAQTILETEYDHAELYFNWFRNMASYRVHRMPMYNKDQVSNAGKLSLYDSIDEDVLRSYHEFQLTSLIFYAMREGTASEQSSRMTAMESATKNAGEMIDRLTMLYNRKRQGVITTELIEIISGAAALE